MLLLSLKRNLVAAVLLVVSFGTTVEAAAQLPAAFTILGGAAHLQFNVPVCFSRGAPHMSISGEMGATLF